MKKAKLRELKKAMMVAVESTIEIKKPKVEEMEVEIETPEPEPTPKKKKTPPKKDK